MIVKKGTLCITEEGAETEQLLDIIDRLPDGIFNWYITDSGKNRSLPQLKYFCGVVLKTISDELPGHPPIMALYRYFEDLYSPKHSCTVDGMEFDYTDFKSEKSVEMETVIELVVRHAKEKWHIDVPDRDVMKSPEASGDYMDAYLETWKSIRQQ